MGGPCEFARAVPKSAQSRTMATGEHAAYHAETTHQVGTPSRKGSVHTRGSIDLDRPVDPVMSPLWSIYPH
jgi:hypothetical protein